jgi:hypothetical protein
MAEHFPKSTLTATGWCLKCHRNTEHQVDDGRLGRCLDENHPVRDAQGKPAPPAAEQKELFAKR